MDLPLVPAWVRVVFIFKSLALINNICYFFKTFTGCNPQIIVFIHVQKCKYCIGQHCKNFKLKVYLPYFFLFLSFRNQ